MSTTKRRLRWLLLAGAILTAFSQAGHADLSFNLDIKVSITASKSLTVNTTSYNFGALAPNVSSVSATPITVSNNSGGITETYTIQGANAISDSGGTDWTLDASTGTDQFALASQFGDARPGDTDSDWSADDLTTNAIACTDSDLGNGVSGETGLNVSPTIGDHQRSLWFRIKTPDQMTDPGSHTIQVTLAVQ